MAVTNVRTFNGSSDRIATTSGGSDSGWGTYLAVLQRNATARDTVFGGNQGASQDGPQVLLLETALNGLGYSNGSAGVTYNAGIPITVVNADGWVICVVTKATGTVAPRAHRCLLSAATWQHGDMASTIANPTSPVSGWNIGCRDNGSDSFDQFFGGDLYCVARWNASVLSDGAIEGLTSTAAIVAATPTNLWVLNQASVGTSVTDTMGTGADQNAISGTTVTSGVTIPNFDTGGGAPVAPARSLVGAGL